MSEAKRLRDKARQESIRREQGCTLRAEYEETSLSQTRPWERIGVSRATWYRWRIRAPASPSPEMGERQ